MTNIETAATDAADRVIDAVMAKFRTAAASVGHDNPTNDEVFAAFAKLFPAPHKTQED